MFRLAVAILIIFFGDWVFFDGDLVVRRLAHWIEAGADTLAGFVFKML